MNLLFFVRLVCAAWGGNYTSYTHLFHFESLNSMCVVVQRVDCTQFFVGISRFDHCEVRGFPPCGSALSWITFSGGIMQRPQISDELAFPSS